jgi:hypothetical protein
MIWKVNHPPPLPLSVLLGVFLHNLRSSLDHIAWQLVLDNGGTPVKKTSFQIVLKRKGALPKIAGGISAKAATTVLVALCPRVDQGVGEKSSFEEPLYRRDDGHPVKERT